MRADRSTTDRPAARLALRTSLADAQGSLRSRGSAAVQLLLRSQGVLAQRMAREVSRRARIGGGAGNRTRVRGFAGPVLCRRLSWSAPINLAPMASRGAKSEHGKRRRAPRRPSRPVCSSLTLLLPVVLTTESELKLSYLSAEPEESRSGAAVPAGEHPSGAHLGGTCRRQGDWAGRQRVPPVRARPH